MSNMCQTEGRQLTDTSQIGVMMERITIRLPPQQIELLGLLVESGEFPTVSEAVRYAVRDFLSQRGDKIMRDSDQVTSFDGRL